LFELSEIRRRKRFTEILGQLICINRLAPKEQIVLATPLAGVTWKHLLEAAIGQTASFFVPFAGVSGFTDAIWLPGATSLAIGEGLTTGRI
jgi:hypothetical protein